jgi:ribosomal protein S18 acetylase RimI-like enzyme
MPIHSRMYVSEVDYERMRQLVIDIYALCGPLVYATPGDLDWWRFPHDDQGEITGARLWFDDRERLVAFAWPSRGQVDIVVHPDDADLYEATLSWAEDKRSRAGGADGDTPTLTAWAFENDDARRTILLARGYEPTDEILCHRARRLDTPIPIPFPRLPAGYRLDHIHDNLIESRAAAQRNAFQSTKMTAAKYRQLKNAPTYRPDLDLVILDPAGEVAAFALVWFDESNRAGTFEPVGTRFDHQRRGLAQALLEAGMKRLQEFGAETAVVLSREGSEAANRLYDSVRMHVVGRNIAWTKRVSGGMF